MAAMMKLLDRLEQAGYTDADGQLLSNDRDWHQLRQVLKNHPGWPGVAEEEPRHIQQVRRVI